MKLLFKGLLFFISFTFIACDDSFPDLGSSIRPIGDQISLSTDTFHLVSENYFSDPISQSRNPSQLIIGHFYDERYGSTSAEIFAQFNCPVGFIFPPNATPDSVILRLNFNNVYGDTLSPMNVSVYEMNKASFSYSGSYFSTLDPSDYASPLQKLGDRIIKARVKTTNATDFIRIKLDGDNFPNRFFNDAKYSSITDFITFFKGLYIKTEFGSSTMLLVKNIDMLYYYHYFSPQGDTINHYKTFSSSDDVRRVNRIIHHDTASIRQTWSAHDSLNYVAAPSKIYTRVRIPLQKINNSMKSKLGDAKQLMINSAVLKVELKNGIVNNTLLTPPRIARMLLIKESEINSFFSKRLMPSDTLAIYAELGTQTIAGVTSYHYSFNLGGLIAREIQNSKTTMLSDLEMVLMPITTELNKDGNVIAIHPEYGISAITIASGKHPTSPMRIKMVYSGF
jgi:hypothetical protein